MKKISPALKENRFVLFECAILIKRILEKGRRNLEITFIEIQSDN
jgi:hypothetical protein